MPYLLRLSVEFGFLEAFDGHKFWPEESLRRSWPEAVMTRAAEPLTGDFPLADQTMVFSETLWYQTEKV